MSFLLCICLQHFVAVAEMKLTRCCIAVPASDCHECCGSRWVSVQSGQQETAVAAHRFLGWVYAHQAAGPEGGTGPPAGDGHQGRLPGVDIEALIGFIWTLHSSTKSFIEYFNYFVIPFMFHLIFWQKIGFSTIDILLLVYWRNGTVESCVPVPLVESHGNSYFACTLLTLFQNIWENLFLLP